MYDLFKDMSQVEIISTLFMIKILFVITLKAASKKRFSYEIVNKIEVYSMCQSGWILWDPVHRFMVRYIQETRSY